MKRFARVTEILEGAVNGETIKAHGNFWRGKSLDQFVALKVFGQRLVVPGAPADSALIKAMRGLAPFGSDVDPRPPGAVFRRMPAGRAAVPAASIQFIEQWIAEGCPDDEIAAPEAAAGAAPPAVDQFVRFFREFDNFFMFEASDQTSAEIQSYFGAAQGWPGFGPEATVSAWTAALGDAGLADAARYLCENQLRIIGKYFTPAADPNPLMEALWLFGKAELPPDPLRPQDPLHKMDGAVMWLFWLGSIDAAIRLGIHAGEWPPIAKSVCLGLVADALFRTDRPPAERLKIARYDPADPDVRRHIVNDLTPLAGDDLLATMIGLGREALFGPPLTG